MIKNLLKFLFFAVAFFSSTFSQVDRQRYDFSVNNAQFAWNLYKNLSNQEYIDRNLFISPFSISSALAMTHSCTGGQTADQIKSKLHLEYLSDYSLHVQFQDALEKLKSINSENSKVLIANGIFLERKFLSLENCSTNSQEYFGAGVEHLDFTNNPMESVTSMNLWVSNATNGFIDKVVDSDSINRQTILLIINAVYFTGNWKYPFDPDHTRDSGFYFENAQIGRIQLMRRKMRYIHYSDNEELDSKILELPYKDGPLKAYLLLPNTDTGLANLDSKLTPEHFTQPRLKFGLQEVSEINVFIPRFKFETSLYLKETLTHLGMSEIFNDQSDLSKLTSQTNIKVSNVIHKSLIDVSERGSEVAGLISVENVRYSIGDDSNLIFRADKPFIFFISDSESGQLVLIGKVIKPIS